MITINDTMVYEKKINSVVQALQEEPSLLLGTSKITDQKDVKDADKFFRDISKIFEKGSSPLPERVRLFLGGEFMRYQDVDVARDASLMAHTLRTRFDAKSVRRVLWSLDLSRELTARAERTEIIKLMMLEKSRASDHEKFIPLMDPCARRWSISGRRVPAPLPSEDLKQWKEVYEDLINKNKMMFPETDEYLKKMNARRDAKSQSFIPPIGSILMQTDYEALEMRTPCATTEYPVWENATTEYPVWEKLWKTDK